MTKITRIEMLKCGVGVILALVGCQQKDRNYQKPDKTPATSITSATQPSEEYTKFSRDKSGNLEIELQSRGLEDAFVVNEDCNNPWYFVKNGKWLYKPENLEKMPVSGYDDNRHVFDYFLYKYKAATQPAEAATQPARRHILFLKPSYSAPVKALYPDGSAVEPKKLEDIAKKYYPKHTLREGKLIKK